MCLKQTNKQNFVPQRKKSNLETTILKQCWTAIYAGRLLGPCTAWILIKSGSFYKPSGKVLKDT